MTTDPSGNATYEGVVGTEKYDSTYNNPYMESTGYRQLPYKLMALDEGWTQNMVLYGILKAMDYPS